MSRLSRDITAITSSSDFAGCTLENIVCPDGGNIYIDDRSLGEATITSWILEQAGSKIDWISIDFVAPPNTSVLCSYRVSRDGKRWSDWTEPYQVAENEVINVPPAMRQMYVQGKLILRNTDKVSSPRVKNILFGWK